MMSKLQDLLADLNETWTAGAGKFLYEEKDDKIIVTISTNKKVRSENNDKEHNGDIIAKCLLAAEEYSFYEQFGYVIIEMIFLKEARREKKNGKMSGVWSGFCYLWQKAGKAD